MKRFIAQTDTSLGLTLLLGISAIDEGIVYTPLFIYPGQITASGRLHVCSRK